MTIRKIQMPSLSIATKGMTPEERAEHIRKLREWRQPTEEKPK